MTQLGLARLGWDREQPKSQAGAWSGVQDVKRRQREALLLSYVPMSFTVALALTKHKIRARDLARDVLTWAWNADDSIVLSPDFKMKLLSQLRLRSACMNP